MKLIRFWIQENVVIEREESVGLTGTIHFFYGIFFSVFIDSRFHWYSSRDTYQNDWMNEEWIYISG